MHTLETNMFLHKKFEYNQIKHKESVALWISRARFCFFTCLKKIIISQNWLGRFRSNFICTKTKLKSTMPRNIRLIALKMVDIFQFEKTYTDFWETRYNANFFLTVKQLAWKETSWNALEWMQRTGKRISQSSLLLFYSTYIVHRYDHLGLPWGAILTGSLTVFH